MRLSVGSIAILVAGLSALSARAAATNTMGDVVFGSYDFPCAGCTDKPNDFSYSSHGLTTATGGA
jgi:hypothetical protein